MLPGTWKVVLATNIISPRHVRGESASRPLVDFGILNDNLIK
jgi:hypothetical protein